MKMKKYKLFWKLGDADKNIIYKGFNDEEEYYSFLKDCACLFSKHNTDSVSNIAKTQH